MRRAKTRRRTGIGVGAVAWVLAAAGCQTNASPAASPSDDPVPTGDGAATSGGTEAVGLVEEGPATDPDEDAVTATVSALAAVSESCPKGDCKYTCQRGQSCTYDCSGGDCEITCKTGAECSTTCGKSGQCQLSVEVDAKSMLRCEGPACETECQPGGKCRVACPGGKCLTKCGDGARCNVDCSGGNCRTPCADGSACNVVCSAGCS